MMSSIIFKDISYSYNKALGIALQHLSLMNVNAPFFLGRLGQLVKLSYEEMKGAC